MPLQENVPLSAAAMRLLIQAETNKRIENEETVLNCDLIDDDVHDEFKNYLDALKLKLDSVDADVRMQAIIKSGAHYTTIDFLLSKQGSQFLVLDSAGDMRAHSHYQKLIKSKLFTGLIVIPEALSRSVSGTPQDDTFSCGAFALDFACQCSKIDNLFDYVGKRAKRGMLAWHDLPPQLVWNTHSIEWLNAYMQKNPASKSIISDYLAEFNIESAGKHNRAVITSFQGYQAQVTSESIEKAMHNQVLETSPTAGSLRSVQSVLFNRSGKSVQDDSDHPGYTPPDP
jgi:hypothetical protein